MTLAVIAAQQFVPALTRGVVSTVIATFTLTAAQQFVPALTRGVVSTVIVTLTLAAGLADGDAMVAIALALALAVMTVMRRSSRARACSELVSSDSPEASSQRQSSQSTKLCARTEPTHRSSAQIGVLNTGTTTLINGVCRRFDRVAALRVGVSL